MSEVEFVSEKNESLKKTIIATYTSDEDQQIIKAKIEDDYSNLISEITSYLTDKGGEFSGVTFATLGRVCELTMVYHKSEKLKSMKLGLS